MINEGKNKIQHLRQFRNMSDEVLKQMNEIDKMSNEVEFNNELQQKQLKTTDKKYFMES